MRCTRPRRRWEEGIVAGGGVALLYAGRTLDRLNTANDDQKVGLDIVRKAVQRPTRQIAENAGVDGSIVVGKLLDRKDSNFGFDAQSGEYRDLFDAASSIRPRSCGQPCKTPPRWPAS